MHLIHFVPYYKYPACSHSDLDIYAGRCMNEALMFSDVMLILLGDIDKISMLSYRVVLMLDTY